MPLTGEIKNFTRIKFVLIDYPSPSGELPEPGRNVRESPHRWSCRMMEELIKTYTNFEVVKVYVKGNFKKKEFLQQIDAVLAGETENNLVIFYYQGKAGGDEKQYTWKFEKSQNKPINAYNVIEKICAFPTNSLLLLDCPMPTHFSEKFYRDRGTTEIIASGGDLRDADGILEEGLGKTFTDCMINSLRWWVESMSTRKKARKNTFFLTLRQIFTTYKIPFKSIRHDIRGRSGVGCFRIKAGRSGCGRDKFGLYGATFDGPEETEEPEHEDEGYQELDGVEVTGSGEKVGEGEGCSDNDHGDENVGVGDAEVSSLGDTHAQDESLFVQPDETMV